MRTFYAAIYRVKLLLFLFFTLFLANKVYAQTKVDFPTSGNFTFTVPPGITNITVECWGGGGNGGAATAKGVLAGGGGGGAYARKLVTVTPGSTYTVKVGAASEDSWFINSTTVMAKAGASVANNSTNGATGGSAVLSIGDQTYSGGNGAASGTGSGGGGSSAGSEANGGNANGTTGGSAPGGGGAGADGITKPNKDGISGNRPGGGGSGGWKNGTGGSAGAGGDGQVIISYYTLTATSATSTCQGTPSLITLSSSATVLPDGTYAVTYNLSGANSATGNTATMTVSNGTGTFLTSNLTNAGSTTITITNLASGFYSSSIGAQNTSSFNVTAATQPTITAGGNTTICSGNSVVLTSSAATTYKWYVNGQPITGATSRDYTASVSGVYTVVTTNGSGCMSPVSAGTTVTVNNLPVTPVISANGPTTFCADGNLTLTSTTASSYQWYKAGVAIGGATNQTYSPTSTGMYTLIVKNDAGCSSPVSEGTQVIVNALPSIPNITAEGPTSFCYGGSVTLTSDMATSYQWYDDEGIIEGATNKNYTTSATGSYFVRVTNTNGCAAVSATKPVTNNPLPDITVASQASSQCSNASEQLSQLVYSNTGNGPTTYNITWNSGALTAGFTNVSDESLPAGTIPVTVPANAATNTYSGTLTVKNVNGCESSPKTFTVSITSSPNVSNFSITTANGCAGTGALITVNSTSLADGTYTVKYNLSGSNSSADNTATMTFSGNSGTFMAAAANTGPTNITITEISVIGCFSPVNDGNTGSFTINALPEAPSLSGADNVCAKATITLIPSVTGGTWASSEPSVATVSNGVVSGLASGTTVITFTTDPNLSGCVSSIDKTITVNAIPAVEAITGPTTLCLNTTSNLNNPTANGSWTSSDPSVATIESSGLVSALSIGSAIIKYTTAENEAGCANSTSVTVSVNAQPGVSAGEDIEVCESASPTAFTLDGAVLSGGATSAIWSIEAGGGGTLSNQGAGTNPSAVAYTPAANFHGSVVLTLTTNAVGSCGAATSTRTINITESPKVNAGPTLVTCQSASPSGITLTDASVSGGANTGAWSIVSGGGTLSSTDPMADPSTITYTPAVNFSGTVTLRLTTNATGICAPIYADRTITVTPIPVVNAGTQNSICQSATPVAFTLDGAGYSGGATKAAWSITGGSGTLSSTALTTNPAAVTFKPNDNYFGTVKLTLTSDAPGGCGAVTAERIIDITQASTVVAGDPVTVCQAASPAAITLAGAGVGGGATNGQWSIISESGGTLSSALPTSNPESVTFTPEANFNGQVSLLLTANATGNCPSVSATRTINISPNGTIALTSATGTDNQIKCVSANAITDIKYTVGGNATGAELTAGAFPAGVNGSFSDGVFTISGIPTAAGTFSYTLTTTGSSCVNESISGTITVNAASVGGNLSPDLIAVCSGGTPTITLSGNVGSVVRWEKSVNAGSTWATIANTAATYSPVVTQPTLFRAVIQNGSGAGVCSIAYSTASQVIVDAPFTPTVTASPASTVCYSSGPVTLTASGYTNSGLVINGGDFQHSNEEGWSAGNASNSNGNPNSGWAGAATTITVNGVTYNSGDPKFMIVTGTGGTSAENKLSTPTFSLVGLSGAYLAFNQAYNLGTGAKAEVQISMNGGSTYTTLETYTGSAGTTSNFNSNPKVFIDLGPYLGMTNLKLQFSYTPKAGSNWAIDNVVITDKISNPSGVGVYNDVTYTWSPVANLSSSTGQSVTFTPPNPNGGTYTYNVTTTTSAAGCVSAVPGTITITVNPPASITTQPTVSAAQCIGSSASISATIVGTPQWQVSTNGGTTWTSLSNEAPYSGVTTTTLDISATTPALATYLYRIMASAPAPCSNSVTSNSVSLKVKNVWTGTDGTDWNTGSNWSDGTVPGTTCPTVAVPVVPINNYPVLSTGNMATINNLEIATSASATITGNTIQISGAITNNGIFNVTDGTVEFNGAATQNIAGHNFANNIPGKNNTVKNLIISNNVNVANTVGDTLNITGLVSFGTPTAKLNTGNNLTLKSTKDNTAGIGVLGAGNAVSGQVEVERYINIGPGGHAKTWQFLATPTQGQSLKESWMENGSTAITGYGAQFTGTAGTSGYDAQSVAPSVKLWDEGIGNWKEFANTANPLYDSRGYFAFVRGDRTVTGFNGNTAPKPTTLRSKGTILTGNQTFTAPYALPLNVFYSIGNPYPSAIDMTKVFATVNENSQVLPFFYVWNAGQSDGYYNVGNWNLSTFIDGHYVTVPGFQQNDVIESGQAFLMQEDASYPTAVLFTEDAKVASGGNQAFREQTVTSKHVQLITNLWAVSPDGNTSLSDGTLQQFDKSYTNKLDRYDAKKIMNASNNFAIKILGENLVVERRAPLTEQDTIQYNMSSMAKQNYRLEFKALGLSSENVEGFVEDTYLDTRTPLNMEGTTHVDFAVTSDKGSYAANRFRIVFKTAVVLPVKFVSVIAVQKDEDIEVSWKTENEKAVKQYDVEKSVDGVSYKKAYAVAADNNGAGSYQWLDEQAIPGDNYYRIRMEEESGKISYSDVVKVSIPLGKPSIGIYPNPITDGIIHLQFVNQPKGRYGLRLLNPLGQTIIAKHVEHAGGNATENIKWDYNLAHGVYQLQILKPDGKIQVIKVMY